jgi:hypothetical protein
MQRLHCTGPHQPDGDCAREDPAGTAPRPAEEPVRAGESAQTRGADQDQEDSLEQHPADTTRAE